MWDDEVEFTELIGKTITEVEDSEYNVTFKTSDGSTYEMYHEKDCCEVVYLEDITGSWDDIVGQVVTDAFVNTNDVDCDDGEEMWTFYTLETFKGAVTLRWNGSSNGYYSIGVGFFKV